MDKKVTTILGVFAVTALCSFGIFFALSHRKGEGEKNPPLVSAEGVALDESKNERGNAMPQDLLISEDKVTEDTIESIDQAVEEVVSSEVSELVKSITELMVEIPLRERLQHLSDVEGQLTLEDIAALNAFIANPSTPFGFTPVQLFYLKNRILNLLQRSEQMHAELVDTLKSVYEDQSHPLQMRDYAIQHLSSLHSSFDDPDSIEAVFWQVTNEKNSLAGTALLALNRIERKEGLEPEKVGRLKEKAIALIKDKDADVAAKITAIQIAGHLKMEENVPLFIDIAKNDESTSVRLSAIAALGYLESNDEIKEVLNRLNQTADPRIQTAANAALKRLAKL